MRELDVNLAEPAGRRAGALRTIAVASTSSAVSVAPVFLVAGLAPFVKEDFPFGPSDLGVAVTSFFLASALTAVPSGRLTEKIGARRAMLGAATVSGIAAMGIAGTARSMPTLVLWLVLAGISNGVAQPAGNLALARGVPPRRLGIAFGAKLSAIPSATLAAGFAVPLLGLTVGWRWAFVGMTGVVVLLAIAMPKDPYRSPRVASQRLREGDVAWPALVVLAIAAAFGAAVATSLAAFYVQSAVDAGLPVGLAGGLLVMGSIAVIGMRVWIGWHVDRASWDQLGLVIGLMIVGTVGYGGLIVSEPVFVLVVATLLAFVAGWGWPGLFNLAVVRLNSNAPAAATSITQTGVFLGGIAGPVLFGRIAESVSFGAAWSAAAVVNLGAAVAVVVARRMLPGS